MIFTNRTITVRKGEARIDEPIVIYRGDYELEVRFTIMNSRFRFMSGTNLIDTEKASYGQLAVLTPYGGNVFSDIAKCSDGAVTFVLSRKMLDQIEEVGLYSFQIRLFDYIKESRVSIPPVEFGIEVREPITSEDHDNSVNNAIVGYSIAKVVDPKEENVGYTFDESGNYNKTKWETGDRISEGKLNKIEDAIDKINENEINNSASLSKRIDNNFSVLDATKADTLELEVQKSRVDSLTALSHGSTTGDAELIDGRIGCDGRVYNNIGNAIREQIKSSIDHFISLPFYLTENYYVRYQDGLESYHENKMYKISNYIELLPGARNIFIDNVVYPAKDKAGVAFYDGTMNFISGYQYDNISDVLKIEIPNNSVYMRFTYTDTPNNIGAVKVYQDNIEILNNINDIIDTEFGYRIHLSKKSEGRYIRYDGAIDKSNRWYISDSISLDRGEILYVYSRGYNRNVSVVSKKQSDIYTPLVVSIDSNPRWYTYMPSSDNEDVVISANADYIGETKVLKLPSPFMGRMCEKLNNALNNNVEFKSSSYISYYNGNVSTVGNISHLSSSNYIPVNPNSEIILFGMSYPSKDNAGLAFYNKDKEYISGIQYGKLDNYDIHVITPPDSYFVRLTVLSEYIPVLEISTMSLYGLRNELDYIRNELDYIRDDDLSGKFNYCQMFHKIAGIGDSLMSGEIVVWNDSTQSKEYIDCYNYSWLSNLCKNTGSKAVHYSKGGRTAETWLSEFLVDMKSEVEKPSAYFIALGTNDSNRGVTLGDEDDCGTNNNTFYGLYSRIIEEVMAFNPNATIFCMSLYFNEGDRSVSFSDAIKKIAKRYGCYYVDFLNAHPEYSNDPSVKNDYVAVGHFTTLGYIRVADNILELVNDILRENARDFRFFSKNFMELE